MRGNWYKVLAYGAHKGTKKRGDYSREITFYIYANNVYRALRKCHRIRGIKRDIIQMLCRLTDKEGNILEAEIANNPRIRSIKFSRKTFYSPHWPF